MIGDASPTNSVAGLSMLECRLIREPHAEAAYDTCVAEVMAAADQRTFAGGHLARAAPVEMAGQGGARCIERSLKPSTPAKALRLMVSARRVVHQLGFEVVQAKLCPWPPIEKACAIIEDPFPGVGGARPACRSRPARQAAVGPMRALEPHGS